MKNKTVKIALLSVVLIGGLFALNHFKKMKKVEVAAPKDELPKEFTIPSKSSDVSTRYYISESKYFKVTQSPLTRSTPVEITKEEYLAAYEAYKL